MAGMIFVALNSADFNETVPTPASSLARQETVPTRTPIPTPTHIPVIPALIEPTPTQEPTVEPTATATPIPTSIPTSTPGPAAAPTDYWIDDLSARLIGERDGLIAVDFSVHLINVRGQDGSRPVLVEVTVDGGDRELIYIIKDMKIGEAIGFVFQRELTSGRHDVVFTVKDLDWSVTVDVEPTGVSFAAAPTATPTATLTPEPVDTPVTLTPTPTNTPLPTATPVPPTATAVPTATPAPVVRIAAPTPTPDTATELKPTLAPHLRHLEHKQYMLELINAERLKVGLHPVVLGDNTAAQLHAEASLAGCFSSHWGLDGLKPYMRYSLAGGYQSNSENGHGSDYCIADADRYRPIQGIQQEILKAMEGWMDSPGHRRNILRPGHKKVNIGIAWDRYNFKAYQHFEAYYVEYVRIPDIQDGILTLSGTLKNGAGFAQDRDLGLQIYYDSPPHELTLGQVSRTYCYDSGRLAASLREPLTGNWFYTEDEFTRGYSPCPDPYDVPANSPGPRSHDEAHEFWQAAYNASKARVDESITVPWITASIWEITADSFTVAADLSDVIAAFDNGVYTVMLWAKLGGERVVVSQYSIFHGVTTPDTYDQDR